MPLPTMVRSFATRGALTAAALALAFLALPADAQWKWRDKGGRVQYSDLPPPSGTAEQDILAKPGAGSGRRSGALSPLAGASAAASAASSVALTPRTSDPELEARRKKAEADQAAKTKVDELKVAQARLDNCSRAKTQLKTLESGMRLVRTNDKGEREFLDDKQRADETKRTQETITADCK